MDIGTVVDIKLIDLFQHFINSNNGAHIWFLSIVILLQCDIILSVREKSRMKSSDPAGGSSDKMPTCGSPDVNKRAILFGVCSPGDKRGSCLSV